MTDEPVHMNELMARDPLELSDQDLDKIIKRFRDSHEQFKIDNFQATRKKTKTASAAKTKVDPSLSLGDLGLDL